MRKTLRNISLPKIVSLGFALLLIFLTLSLNGCAGLKKFPTDKLYEFDPKEPVCAEYQIIDYENLKFKHVRDIPFKQCPAIFGFLDKDISKVLTWGRESIAYGRQHCQ